MDVRTFQRANAARAAEWHKGGDEWTLADWAVAMAGEAGEACNIVKKLRRFQTGIRGNAEHASDLRAALAEELADTVTYAALLAEAIGCDLEAELVRKFNAVSDKHGFEFKL